jgi:hypothetical protein
MNPRQQPHEVRLRGAFADWLAGAHSGAVRRAANCIRVLAHSFLPLAAKYRITI